MGKYKTCFGGAVDRYHILDISRVMKESFEKETQKHKASMCLTELACFLNINYTYGIVHYIILLGRPQMVLISHLLPS